jgi:DNA repair exonuclease SbcCD ATPase subunit
LEQEIAAIRTFLASLNVPSITNIAEQQVILSTRLAELIAEENEIRHKIRVTSNHQADIIENAKYGDLRQEFIEKRGTLDVMSRELANLTNQVKEKLDLKGILEDEARKLTRHLAAKHVVSTFSFSQCPRCQQQITEQMYLREANGNCFLCNRPLGSNEQDSTAWQKALRDIQQTITEVNQLIVSYQERIRNIEKEIPQLSNRISRLESMLQSQTAEYVSPFVEYVSLHNEEKADLERSISRLQYQLTERQHANDLETKRLPDVENQLEQVTGELNTLRSKIGAENERYSALIYHYRYFMDNVDTVQNIFSISWDADEQLPIIYS